jgi:hypothetical protein
MIALPSFALRSLIQPSRSRQAALVLNNNAMERSKSRKRGSAGPTSLSISSFGYYMCYIIIIPIANAFVSGASDLRIGDHISKARKNQELNPCSSQFSIQ